MRAIISVVLLAAVATTVVAQVASADYTCPRGTDMVNGKCVER